MNLFQDDDGTAYVISCPEVKAGDTVVILEAMKMANNIEAEKEGKVTAICVKVGQAVLEEDPLVVIE
jgi:biotin carboxyl carrier protein